MSNYSPDELDVKFNVPAMARIIIPKLEESIDQNCNQIYRLPDSVQIAPVPVCRVRQVASKSPSEEVLFSIASHRGRFMYCRNSVVLGPPISMSFWRGLSMILQTMDGVPGLIEGFMDTVFPGCDLQVKLEDWQKLIDNAVQTDSAIAEFVHSRISIPLVSGSIHRPNFTKPIVTSWHSLNGDLYVLLGTYTLINCGPLPRFQSAFQILSQDKPQHLSIDEVADAEFLNDDSDLEGIEIIESTGLVFQHDDRFYLLNSESMEALAKWFAKD